MIDVYGFSPSGDLDFKNHQGIRVNNIFKQKGFWLTEFEYGLDFDFFVKGSIQIGMQTFSDYISSEMKKWGIVFFSVRVFFQEKDFSLQIEVNLNNEEAVVYAL